MSDEQAIDADENENEERDELHQKLLERREAALAYVVKFGDPVLKSRASEVHEFGPELRAEVERMIRIMQEGMGVGLAATQLGVLRRVLVFQAGADNEPSALVNPKIEWLSDETEISDEGCLSFPGVYVPIKRSLRARVRAVGLDGQEFVAEGEGLYARAMQHENDHLENKLLIDYVGPIKRQMIKRKMERMTDEEAEELQAQGE